MLKAAKCSCHISLASFWSLSPRVHNPRLITPSVFDRQRGRKRECSFPPGCVIICFTVSRVDSDTANRLRFNREKQEGGEDCERVMWLRRSGSALFSLVSSHSNSGLNWLDLLFPASHQVEQPTLNSVSKDMKILLSKCETRGKKTSTIT